MTASRFALFLCEDSPKWQGAHGLLPRLLHQPGDTWVTYSAFAGALPQPSELGSFQGIVITGSHYNLTERAHHPWMDALLDIVRCAIEHGMHGGPRVVGVCFGHQVLAEALGGKVGKNNGGFCYGAYTITGSRQVLGQYLVGAAVDGIDGIDGIASAAEDEIAIRAHKSHGECVVEMPPGGRVLLSSESCRVEAFAWRDVALGVQSHPELTSAHLRRLIGPSLVDSLLMDAATAVERERSFAGQGEGEACKHCDELMEVPLPLDYFGALTAALPEKRLCADAASHRLLVGLMQRFLRPR